MGNCQECALFDLPESPDDQEFFGRVTETILALANSFGGWLIFGVSTAWLGGVDLPEVGNRLTLRGLLETSPAWLRGEIVRILQQAVGPVDSKIILGEPGKSGLGLVP